MFSVLFFYLTLLEFILSKNPDHNGDMNESIARVFLAKKRDAAEKGIDFNLTLTSIRNILRSKKCYWSGVPIDIDMVNGGKISIDRIDATKGYIVGNVVACSTEANKFKSFVETGHQRDKSKLIQNYKRSIRMMEKALKKIQE